MFFAAALLVLGSMVLTPMGSEGLSAIARAQDGLEEFLARSPGERGLVIEQKGKGGGKSGPVGPVEVAFAGPSEEALGKIFDIPRPDEELIAGTEPPSKPSENSDLVVVPNVLVPGGLVPNAGTPVSGGGGSGGGFPGGGGPGAGNPPGGTPPTGTPPTPGPVPEPSTWALLIIGFFSVGAALRKRRVSFTRALNA